MANLPLMKSYLNIYTDLYYLQLTEGCISFKCQHPQCKSCPNFIYSSETNDSLREKANELASNHHNDNLLCPNFPPTLYDFSIFENVLIFNDFLTDFIHHRDFQDSNKIVRILSDFHSYPFLFSYDLNEIDFYSIHPPSDLINDFIYNEKSNSKDLKFLQKAHNDMVNEIIAKSPKAKSQMNSLYHLRSIYVSFLFYSLFSENDSLLFTIIKHTMSLLPYAHLLLSDMISKSPLLIEELNAAIQKAISEYVKKNSKKIDDTMWNAAKFIHFILVPANNKCSQPIQHHLFANSNLSKNFLAKIELRRYISNRPTFIHTPSVISLIKKSHLLPNGNVVTTSPKANKNLLEVNSSFKLKDFIRDETPENSSFSLEEEDFYYEEEEEEEEFMLEEEESATKEEENENDSESKTSSDNENDDDLDFVLDLIPSRPNRPTIISRQSPRGRLQFLRRIINPRFISQEIADINSDSDVTVRVSTNSNNNHNSDSQSVDDDNDENSNRNFDSVDISDFDSDDSDEGIGSRTLKISVRRDHLLDDTLVALLTADQKELMGHVKVRFKGEEAYDAGGVSREFFTLVTSTLFSPDYGMFELIDDRFYWFRNSSDNADLSRYFKLLGAFIGIAINNKVILPIRFPLLMYKKLLNYKNSVFNISDLAEIDPSVAKSLASLLESKEKGENVEDAGLMFDFSFEYFDTIQTKELIENGSNIPVTNDNVDDYIQKFIDWKLNKSIEKQFLSFKEGYDMNCNTPIMKLFAPIELDELVSGLNKLDWEAFKKSVNYSGYNKNSQTIKDLWNIMDNEWNEKQKTDFLYFITGIKTAPVGGLGQLNISIEKEKCSSHLPKSHTCFNELTLPDYKNIDVLRDKLKICLENCEGFGLV